jgi:hypothetical protein
VLTIDIACVLQLLSMESRPWHELSCFSLWDMTKVFRVRIVGVEKINPNTTSFQKVRAFLIC